MPDRAEELIAELQSRALEQELIADFGLLALTERDLGRVCRAAIEALARGVRAEYGEIVQCVPHDALRMLCSSDSRAAEVSIERGATCIESETVSRRLSLSRTLTGEDFACAPHLRAAGIVAAATAVIYQSGEPHGVVLAGTRSPREFTRQDVLFLQAIANMLAAAIGRKRTEEQLRETDTGLRLALQQMPGVLFAVGRDGRVLWSRGSALKSIGLPDEEVSSETIEQRLKEGSADPEVTLRSYRAALAGQPARHTNVYRGRVFDTLYEPLRDGSQVVGVCAIAVDVTDRVAAEEELRVSREQLRALSRRVVSAQEEERRRIARDVHDELGQILAGLKMEAVWLGHHLAAPRAELGERIAEIVRYTDTALDAVRRIASELRPSVLDHFGLCAAVEQEVAAFEQRSGIRCSLAMPAAEMPIEQRRATAIYRVLQESLANAGRHSGASEVRVALDVEGAVAVVSVSDNGRGIAPADLTRRDAFGIIGMRERAAALGGEVDISAGEGGGTLVRMKLPLSELSEG